MGVGHSGEGLLDLRDLRVLLEKIYPSVTRIVINKTYIIYEIRK